MLDFLNVYGVRWLMPFDATWFYGDILYIADPWMWAIMAGALLFARRKRPSATQLNQRPPVCAFRAIVNTRFAPR